MKSLPNTSLPLPNLSLRTTLQILLALATALLLLPRPAQAALVNPSFELNSGHVIPSGWTRFAPPTAQPAGNYYVQGDQAPPHSGALCYKEWGACYDGTNNAAGIYQDLSSAPGAVYQASGWFYTRRVDALGTD